MLDRLWRALFPPGPDFLGMLRRQVDAAAEAIDALQAWMRTPDSEHVRRVQEVETRADAIRVDLSEQLAVALETPLDREDTDTLSHLLDDITDTARFCALHLEAVEARPERGLEDMLDNLERGLNALHKALTLLPAEVDEAHRAIREALHVQRDNQHAFIAALPSIVGDPTPRRMLTRHETYRQILAIGEQVQASARVLEHGLHKLQ